MNIYKATLNSESTYVTPFQADTLFGHICWIVANREGESGLQQFLEPFKNGDPPFILSDGFPAGFLPKPLSCDLAADTPLKRKDIKKVQFLSISEFNAVINGQSVTPVADNLISYHLTAHNTINRITNRPLEPGGLYNVEEYSIPQIDIYIKAESNTWKNNVVSYIEEISQSGYGGKISRGKGQFSISGIIDYSFPEPDNANGFVALSNFCPSEKDTTEGFYSTFIKYGKLGIQSAGHGNPFKKPLLMVRAGSVFFSKKKHSDFCGRIIAEEIAPAMPSAVHYAYGFNVPVWHSIKYP